VVENRGGAGAILGTDMIAKAAPDGYALLLGQSGPISINPAVYKTLPYDPVKDFAPVTMITAYPYVLVVNSELPAKSLQEFVALAKSKPGAMNYGSTGVGAANHLVAELFNSKAGLKMAHIPYRGTALAWHGILAPARTPSAIIRKLNEEIVKALADPVTNKLLTNQAMRTVGNTSEAFAAFIQKDIATWKAVAVAANVAVE